MITRPDLEYRHDSLKTAAQQRNTDIPTWTYRDAPIRGVHSWTTHDRGDEWHLMITNTDEHNGVALAQHTSDNDTPLIALPYTGVMDALDAATITLAAPDIIYQRFAAKIDQHVEADVYGEHVELDIHDNPTTAEYDDGIRPHDIERLITAAHAVHDDAPEWERVKGDSMEMTGWLHLRDDYVAVIMAADDEANGAVVSAHRGASALTGLHCTDYSALVTLIVEAVQKPEQALEKENHDDYEEFRLPVSEITGENRGERK